VVHHGAAGGQALPQIAVQGIFKENVEALILPQLPIRLAALLDGFQE
jgi:hypothetical protein